MKPKPQRCALTLEPMYRGARVPGAPKGPSYFISDEGFAKTYGPTSKFSLCLKKPLEVSPSEWLDDFSAIGDFRTPAMIAAKLKKRGYDSAVSRRPRPGFGEDLVVVFTIDTKPARALAGTFGGVRAKRRRQPRRK
jgi:hypothetical protein